MMNLQHTIEIIAISFVIFQLTSCGPTEDKKFKDGMAAMKDLIKAFIKSERDFNLINWACNYNDRPTEGSSELNIQFDHIPPAKFYKEFKDSAEYDPIKKLKLEIDSGTAPTVAISDFDHHGIIWRQCTTGQSRFSQIFVSLAKMDWDNNKRFKCAIFVNLACLKDVAAKEGDTDVFDRYKDGFKQLVGLHVTMKNLKSTETVNDKNELVKWIESKTNHAKLRSECCILNGKDECLGFINL